MSPQEQQKITAQLDKSLTKIADARKPAQKAKRIADAQASVQALVMPGGLTQAQADDLSGVIAQL